MSQKLPEESSVKAELTTVGGQQIPDCYFRKLAAERHLVDVFPVQGS